ncbi:MAG TPA: DUF1707 domain-containing protein [Solirubrobacteraceae bacterium]|nr:DUF1707 domain-containing protein [Solirubrobacteraceae bacterium]
MNGRHTLRASDTDRDQVAERLRVAATEGRLSTEEFDARLGAALKARTYHELDRLVADLPGKKLAQRRSTSTARSLAGSHPVAAAAVALATITVAIAALAIVAMIGAAWIVWMVFAWIFFGAKRRHTHVRPGRGGQIRPGFGTEPRSSAPSRSSYWA